MQPQGESMVVVLKVVLRLGVSLNEHGYPNLEVGSPAALALGQLKFDEGLASKEAAPMPVQRRLLPDPS